MEAYSPNNDESECLKMHERDFYTLHKHKHSLVSRMVYIDIMKLCGLYVSLAYERFKTFFSRVRRPFTRVYSLWNLRVMKGDFQAHSSRSVKNILNI